MTDSLKLFMVPVWAKPLQRILEQHDYFLVSQLPWLNYYLRSGSPGRKQGAACTLTDGSK